MFNDPLTPCPWSIPSEKNLIHNKFEDVKIGGGALFPQYWPINSAYGPPSLIY
jgi:hypothetical protein